MSTRSVEMSKHTLASISPLTGELLREYEQHSDTVIEEKLQLAQDTFREYRKSSFTQRAQAITRAGEILDQGKATFARIMTEEVAQTMRPAVQERESAPVHFPLTAGRRDRF